MTNDRDELVVLRISLARIAQTLGMDNELKVCALGYAGLHRQANTVERGWNDLACLIVEELENRTSTGSHMRTDSHVGTPFPTAQAIADKFVELLRRDLSPEDLGEVCARNATAAPGVCHSHDFCDANMVMAEAFYTLGLATPVDIDYEINLELETAHDAASKLWSEAWDLATTMTGGK